MKNLKKPILIFATFLIVLLILVICFTKKPSSKNAIETKTVTPTVEFIENKTIEINSSVTLLSFVKKIENGTINIADSDIDTSTIGEKPLWIAVKDNDGNIKTFGFEVNIIDTTPPEISCKNTLYTTVGNKINLLDNVTVSDNSSEQINAIVVGDYSFDKENTYNLKYSAKDLSGNETMVDFKLVVSPKKEVASAPTISASNPYSILVNRDYNVVIVYTLSENNEYTIPIKTFVCSVGTGNNTPVGTFKTTDKYVWRKLVGNVYGQYATRITGSILFHSVPYFSQNKNDLEFEEYNKLGNKASLGCVRLSVSDAKWIYDNCPKSTSVTICDGELPNGIIKPTPIIIDTTSENRGWDPTDPDFKR